VKLPFLPSLILILILLLATLGIDWQISTAILFARFQPCCQISI